MNPNERLTLIVAPYRTATLAEQEQVLCMAAAEQADNRVPLFLPWMLRPILDDEVPEQRESALAASATLTEAIARGGGRCLVLEGRVTEGMRLDFAAWALGDPRRERVAHWVVPRAVPR